MYLDSDPPDHNSQETSFFLKPTLFLRYYYGPLLTQFEKYFICEYGYNRKNGS
jgi:hypothetical protein